MADGARSLVGRIREKLGWLTADRREEARGRLEEAGADEDAEALDRAELEVREDYGDLAPEARPDKS